MSARQVAEVLATGVVAAAVTAGVVVSSLRHVRPIDASALRASGAAVRLAASGASFVFNPASGHVVAKTKDGAVTRELDVQLVVDGEARPLALERSADRATERNAFGASFGIAIGDETFDALVALHVDKTGALAVDLAVEPDEATSAHQFALRLEVTASGRSAFVSGIGELADLGPTTPGSASALEVDAEPHAFAIVPASGPLDVSSTIDAPDAPAAPLRIAASTRAQTPAAGQSAHVGLRFVFAESSASIWRTIAELQGVPALRVAGIVTGAGERARVFGLDTEGQPRVRASVGEGGRFEL